MVDGSVHRTPKSATRGLIDWAIDLWHYVNGRAIVSGINLEELNAGDMLDVLHYFFEDDTHYSSEIQAESKNSLRVHLYESMYQKPYAYASSRARPKSKTFNAEGGLDEQYIADNQEIKPFVPATDFDPESINPFGDLLDRPVGY